MPRFDGPYLVIHANPNLSSYTIEMPNSPNVFPTFHASQLKRFITNDPSLYPSREHQPPGPIVTIDSIEEFYIKRIINQRRRGRGYQYLICWRGYRPEEDHWLAGSSLDDCEALDVWQKEHGLE